MATARVNMATARVATTIHDDRRIRGMVVATLAVAMLHTSDF